ALHFGKSLQIVYVSSRQAVDPGAGVPGYVLANYAVLSLPKILRTNLGKKGGEITAFSLALPFVRTSMTQALADNPRVFGRWQPRMLETNEAAQAFAQLLTRPPEELDDHIFQLDVAGEPDDVQVTWSEIEMAPTSSTLDWSQENPLALK
ncbi:MAG: NAD(P)-dependent dehydrogenase (short-subunit alcohol dehydrogenase family), partial [Myxococcota bacterium]